MGAPPGHAGPRSRRRRGARGPSTPGGRRVSQAGSGRRRAVSHGKACAPWAVPGAAGRAASRKAPPRWGLGGPLLLRGRLPRCAGPGRAAGGAPRPCRGGGERRKARAAAAPARPQFPLRAPRKARLSPAPRRVVSLPLPRPASGLRTDSGPTAGGPGGFRPGRRWGARERPPPPGPQPPRLCGASGVRWCCTPVAAGLIPCHPRVGRDLAPAGWGGAGAGGAPKPALGPGVTGRRCGGPEWGWRGKKGAAGTPSHLCAGEERGLLRSRVVLGTP